MLQEFTDPRWRLNHLYSIVDKQGNRVRFTENAIQARINAHPAKRKRILKARQFGVSTNGILKLFDHTIWKRNVTCGIIAHEQGSIEKLFRIVNRAYKALPQELKPVLDRGGGSKYEMYFPEINSRIYCDLEIRGDTIHRLHVSEAAFIKDPHKLVSTLQAVPLNGLVEIETTPNGIGNHFYEDWMSPGMGYENLFFPWYLHHEYRIETPQLEWTDDERDLAAKAKRLFQVEIDDEQIAFRRLKQAELKSLFAQEYPEDDQSCFLSSGAAAMNLVLVRELYESAPKPIRVEERQGAVVRIYEEYKRDDPYVAGADTAEGIGKDASTGAVYNRKTRKCAATIWSDSLKPSDFAKQLDALCREYTTGGRSHPKLGVERNNHGHTVLQVLEETCHYPNLYEHTDERLGWKTDMATRPILIDTFIEGVESGTFEVQDKDTFAECLTLVKNNGKIEAADGFHDDRVIAHAIAHQMCLLSKNLDLYDNIEDRIRI